MPKRLQDGKLVAELEKEAGLAPGLLGPLLALEADCPDLNARGERKQLYRAIEKLLDAAADEAEGQ